MQWCLFRTFVMVQSVLSPFFTGEIPWETPMGIPSASASAKSCTKTSRRCLQASPPESLGDRDFDREKWEVHHEKYGFNLSLPWIDIFFVFWIWSWKVGIERWQNQDFSQRNGEMIGFYGRWNTSQTTVLNPGMECSSKVRDKPQYPNRQVGLWPGSEFSFLMFMVRKSTLN